MYVGHLYIFFGELSNYLSFELVFFLFILIGG